MPITIKDIAKSAGVSVATVSYVVNSNRYVSPELTARVEEAIQQLGYSPNAVARSLRQQRTKTIGLIVPDSSNPFFAEIAKGVEDAGFDAGYSVILCNSNASIEREMVYLDLLRSKRVEGIIFIATSTRVEQVRDFVIAKIPVVIFYRDIPDIDVDTIRIDNFKAGYLATRHLIELGHREIVCIRPASDETPSAQRVDGFMQAMAEKGLKVIPELMPKGDNRVGGGKAAVDELMTSKQKFTAIFATNDAMAIGSMRALRDYGFRIPQDISVVGVDDIIMASYSEPPLTTITQPKYEAGCQAFEFLLERIDGGYNEGPRDILLETRLIIRESTRQYSLK